MTATMNGNQIYTLKDLEFFLDRIACATECHIYPYGYEDKETSEDPIEVLHGVKETMDWITENPAYPVWGDMTGYLVVIFNRAGFYCEVIF